MGISESPLQGPSSGSPGAGLRTLTLWMRSLLLLCFPGFPLHRLWSPLLPGGSLGAEFATAPSSSFPVEWDWSHMRQQLSAKELLS